MEETNESNGPVVDVATGAIAQLQAEMDASSEAAPIAEAEPTAPEVPEVSAEQKQAEERFAAKFAALSRKEKQIRQREQAMEQRLKQMEAQLQAKESEFSSKYIDPSKIKSQPLDVLKEQGWTPEKLAELMLNDGKPTQDMLMSEYESKFMTKIEALEKKLAEKEAKEQEEKYNNTLTSFQAQLTDFVNKTEDYDLIRANDAVDLVYQVIEQHHAETGQILSNKEASDAVEEYLLEEAKKLVDRDKVKKLLQPTQAKPTQKPTQAVGGKSSPTLSNAVSATATPSSRNLSNEESKAEAAKLIRWEE